MSKEIPGFYSSAKHVPKNGTPASFNGVGKSTPQRYLEHTLGEIYANQDNLTSEDLKTLEWFSKKGYYQKRK